MERDELECFLLLAEELHFGRTADRMRLSRARVSQLVQRLERRVGAPLFVRTSRRVALTALGRQLRADLEPHHRAIAAALERAAATARGIDTVLHVGFPNPLAGEIVMRTTEALRASHPGLAVEVCEVPLADPYGQLRRGEFDLQVAELPVREEDLGEGPTLLAEERVLALGSAHPLAARDAVSLEDLADVPLLTIVGNVPDYWLEHHAPARTPSGRPIARGPGMTQMQEALMLVAAGKGALLVPAHTARYHARPGVAYVPFADAEPTGYGLVWRAGHASGAVQAFARAAREVARTVARQAPRTSLPGTAPAAHGRPRPPAPTSAPTFEHVQLRA
ncbi:MULTISPECIES: LysR family transcriptional regulator [Streptomyces]|uniref:LysR family transcriptional regulator n=1 Tax=Streptomyces tricolor TaxID=68277 RepID=A0ABS9JTH5_9ACTN|nr:MULTISPECIES: LysR family transcriptional regulator [Streptomyces]MCG0068869.1 LysR family transcriptional regulator [Streptomyces tricolor]MYU30911.1 LysR family transcriptional regulator [Streptomyces sp. SID7810]OYP14583.1 LysR family transcriptional regulator [Streptomyces sp. FBKL.4005]CUW32003.1 Hca operon transcriptional activator [Streptomyces reticuli]